MTDQTAEPQFLYLTTIGWKSSQPHTIEIWFVSYNGAYFIVSEYREDSHWVKNIRHNSAIRVRIGDRNAPEWQGTGYVIDPAQEPALATEVAHRMDAKYEWSDGLIVALTPSETPV
jgi:deazaflavin-dependent oxidoreductase (nitroreductase family)